MTNMDPFVQPEQVTFDYQNITSISKLEIVYDELSTLDPTIEWDEHSYHRVVDNDPNTCWNTVQGTEKEQKKGCESIVDINYSLF
jgi:hypothetical protein